MMSDYRFNDMNSSTSHHSSMSTEQHHTGHSHHRYPDPHPSTLHQDNSHGSLEEQKEYKSNSMNSVSPSYDPTSPDLHTRRWSTTSSNSNAPFGTSDQKKRKRIQQACKACSFRRVKCNGQRPCETCIKNDEECIYGQAKKRGPAKGTTRSGGKKVAEQNENHDSNSSMNQPSREFYQERKHQQCPQTQQRQSLEPSSYTGSNSSFTSPPFLPSPRSQYDQVKFSRIPKEYSYPRQNYAREHSNSLSDGRAAFGDPVRQNSYKDVGMAYSNQRYPSISQANRGDPMQAEQMHGYSQRRDENDSFNSAGAPRLPEGQAYQSSRQSTSLPSHDTGHGEERARSRRPQRPVDDGPSTQYHKTNYGENMVPETSKKKFDSFDVTLAEQIHQSTDIGGQDLADLVLGQLYRERREANKSKQARTKKIGNEGVEDNSINALFERDANGNSLVLPDDLQLPTISEEVVKKLFNVFWSVISLHWPLFLRKVYPTVDDLYGMCVSEHPFLLNSICSLSALVWDNSNDGGKLDSEKNSTLTARQLSTIFAVRAHYHHIGAILNPCIESTAALAFLSLRETGAGRPSQAAHFCWTACRMVMDLGLHRQAEMAQIMGSSFTQIEDETRRRVYWSVYVIDKMMAVQLGRPPVLRDAESDCPLPSFEGEENVWTFDSLPQKFFSAETHRQLGPKPLNMATYFTHGCRLARISEPIIAQYNVIKGKQTIGFATPSQPPSASGLGGTMKDQSDWQSTVAYLHRQLEEWDQQTPMNLRWYANKGEAYFPYIIHQQMWAQACRILLHRPYILKPTDKYSGINSHAECSKATDAIWQMFRDYERLFSLRKVPSSTVYCLFSAATIALANTTSIEDDLCIIAKRQLSDIVGWFIQMTETWSSATQHLAILEKLASTINVDLSETGLQEPNLRAALQSKLDSGTLGMFGAERLRKVQNSSSDKQAAISDGKSGVSLMEDIPTFSGARQDPNSNSSSKNSLLANSIPHSINSSAINSTNIVASVNGQLLGSSLGGGFRGSSTVGQGAGVEAGGGSTEEQLDAFWPDMPLGEDFQRWLSFTHTYFTILGNGSNDSEQTVQNHQMAKTTTSPNYCSDSGNAFKVQNVQQIQSQSHSHSKQQGVRNETETINGMPTPHTQTQPYRSNRHQLDRVPYGSSASSSSASSESFYPIQPFPQS